MLHFPVNASSSLDLNPKNVTLDDEDCCRSERRTREFAVKMSEDDDKPALDPSATSAKFRSYGGTLATGDFQHLYLDQVLDNVLENVLVFLTCRRDRNAASLVCKSWYRAEAFTRSEIFVGNCYAVSPRRMIQRFRNVRSVILKGRPRFSDFNLLPPNWGAYFAPWCIAMAAAYPRLEKIRLKRMTVTDEDLALLADSFPSIKELVIVCSEGFGTIGLAIVATKCRQLRVLDLVEDEVSDDAVDWISCFPQSGTCLETLAFDCVDCVINQELLLNLVSRSPYLRKLRVNRSISMEDLCQLMKQTPYLTDLGTGLFSSVDHVHYSDAEYASAFSTCRSLVCLSGFRDTGLDYLHVIYPACSNLLSLNFSYANITPEPFKSVIRHCCKLQILWVLDSVGDEGLQAAAQACKDLQEIRVFPIEAHEGDDGPVSDVGLQAISEGCRKLKSILYFCRRMTNAAVIAMSMNCVDLVVFRLCIVSRHQPDYVTGQPMDEGFGAIVKNCKKLTRLSVSGLLTDTAFRLIGQYGQTVRILSVGFAGDGDVALKYILEGCPELEKLEIRDCPFGDSGLKSGLSRFYRMRFVWMSSCQLTRRGCEEVARALPRVVAEAIDIYNDDDSREDIGTLYMYRSLEAPRTDAPEEVTIL